MRIRTRDDNFFMVLKENSTVNAGQQELVLAAINGKKYIPGSWYNEDMLHKENSDKDIMEVFEAPDGGVGPHVLQFEFPLKGSIWKRPKTRIVKTMKLAEIKIKDNFKETIPDELKLAMRIKEFKNSRRFSNVIILDGEGWLIDGYTQYLVCKMFDIEEVEVELKKVQRVCLKKCGECNFAKPEEHGAYECFNKGSEKYQKVMYFSTDACKSWMPRAEQQAS